jgi:lipase
LVERALWNTGSVPGDVRLAFGRTGEGPKPIVALHGITAQHRIFNAMARHLEHSDGMVGLDLRGRGDSEKPPSGYGLDAHAQDVIRALDYLGIDRGVFVGHSLGAFIGLEVALQYPDRIQALVLLDGGWPRPEETSGLDDADEAIQEGLERAFSRLDMVFETLEDYLDFWFPDQNLTFEDLPDDLADYYLYDLERVDGGYSPKASRKAAEEDAAWTFSKGPTAADLKGVGCPVALVRPGEGFFAGSEPLISDETRDVMAEVLDLRLERLLNGANHYTMLLQGEYAGQIASIVEDFLRQSE